MNSSIGFFRDKYKVKALLSRYATVKNQKRKNLHPVFPLPRLTNPGSSKQELKSLIQTSELSILLSFFKMH